MHELKGYVFRKLTKDNTIEVLKEINDSLVNVGYLLNNNNFFFTDNTHLRFLKKKKEILALELEKESVENEISSFNSFISKWAGKTRKSKLEKRLSFIKKEITNLQSAATAQIDYKSLLDYLNENNVKCSSFNEGLIKLNTNNSLATVKDDFDKLNISHLFNVNYIKLYSLNEVSYNDKSFNGGKNILTKDIVQDLFRSKVNEIIDFSIDYDYFFNDNDKKKVKLLEENLKNSLEDKEMFLVVSDFYLKSYVKFKMIFGVYNGVPYYIYNDILFIDTTDEGNLEKVSQLLLTISLFE